MKLENNERLLLLQIVRTEIRKGQLEGCKERLYSWDANKNKYVKPPTQYGIKKMTTLYELESKLKEKGEVGRMINERMGRNSSQAKEKI